MSEAIFAIQAFMPGMVSNYLDIAAAADPSNPANAGRHETEEDKAAGYRERNGAVYMALGFASLADYRCGITIDPLEPSWPLVFIELPTGQVSWHVPEYPEKFDGHSTAEKYERIERFAEQCQRAYIDDMARSNAGPVMVAELPDNGREPDHDFRLKDNVRATVSVADPEWIRKDNRVIIERVTVDPKTDKWRFWVCSPDGVYHGGPYAFSELVPGWEDDDKAGPFPADPEGFPDVEPTH